MVTFLKFSARFWCYCSCRLFESFLFYFSDILFFFLKCLLVRVAHSLPCFYYFVLCLVTTVVKFLSNLILNVFHETTVCAASDWVRDLWLKVLFSLCYFPKAYWSPHCHVRYPKFQTSSTLKRIFVTVLFVRSFVRLCSVCVCVCVCVCVYVCMDGWMVLLLTTVFLQLLLYYYYLSENTLMNYYV